MNEKPEIPMSFNDNMAALKDSIQHLCIAIASSTPTALEATQMLTGAFALPPPFDDSYLFDDGVFDAPAVEYHIDGKSFDEWGCEIEPTLPFKNIRKGDNGD
jgi:hypothetical protein